MRESEERFGNFLNASNDLVFIKDQHFRYLFVNKANQEFFGLSEQEIIGKTDFELMPEKLAKECLQSDQRAVAENDIVTVEERSADGIFEIRKFPVKLACQEVGVGAFIRDITAPKRAEEALGDSEEKYRNLVESISDIIFEIDRQGTLTYISPVVRNVVGYEAEDLIGKAFLEFVHPEDKDILMKRYSELTEGVEYPSEYRVVGKSGEIRYVRTRTKPIVRDNTFEGARGTLIDVTEQKSAEEALRASEALFRAVIENLQIGISVLNPSMEIVAVNHFFHRIYPRVQPGTRQLCYEIYNDPPKTSPCAYCPCVRTLQDGMVHESLTDTPAGSQVLNYRIISCPIKDAQDHVELVVELVEDITERKRAEDSLRESEERFHGMFERHSAVMILVEPVTGRILDANKSAERFYGYTMSQLRSMNIGEINTLLPSEVETLLLLATKEERNYFVVPTRLANGEVRTVEAHTSPIEQDGKIILFSIIHDITDRKRLEEERLAMERRVLHAQKLESLGVMAGGIAHDFNNQLAVVLGNLELALTDHNLDQETRLSIENAIKASERSAELSRQMLIYSGSAFYLSKDIHLDELLNKKLGLIKSVFPKNISLNLESYSSLPPIKGDPEQIQRAIMNLITNSSEAIGDTKGDVTIKTGVMDCDPTYLSHSRLEEKPEPGRFVFMEIADNGCGMNDETLQRIFDPFFTTKFWGRGLGMAEVMGIVKGHHGALMVDSQIGKGTIIRVLFPAMILDLPSLKTSEVTAVMASKSDSIAERKTILVVDDEELVRGMILRRLQVLGYDTIEAPDGESGVSVFRERLNQIDLVMLDFAMPKMNGVEAFGELIRINPDVKVILCSGYTEDDVLQSFPGQRPAGVLHKPYKMEALKAELDRLLGTTD